MAEEWLKTGGDGFLPDDIAQLLARLNGFPIARWNFLVVEPGAKEGAAFLAETCAALKAEFPKEYQFQCDLMGGDYQEAVKAWARDLPLRESLPPEAEVLGTIDTTLAKASLPIDGKLREALRSDPFSTYEQLLARLEAQKPLKLVVRDDHLIEPDSGRTLVPMLLAHDPLQAQRTAEVLAVVDKACAKYHTCEEIGFLGGHFASLENQRQIMNDMSAVSISGIVLTVLALVLLKVTKLTRLLWLMVPVGLGTLLAGLGMVLGFGWIHGLTLSFGTGLIGLALDHGVHAAFQGPSKGVWYSNLMGVGTTLVVIGVVAFTSIPVLRQLMVFSILGLLLSFALIYVMQRYWPAVIDVKPVRLPWPTSRSLSWALAVLAVVGVAGMFVIKVDLNMQHLGFMQKKTAELYQWFGQTAKTIHRFRFHAGEGASEASLFQEKAWTDSRGIRLESPASYLPTGAEQAAHRATWFGGDCGFRFELALSEVHRKFFSPYFVDRPCERVSVAAFDPARPPAYMKHLASPGGWISMLYPKDDAEAATVAEHFPDSFSLKDVAGKFPALFARELKWMAPISLGLIVLMLLAYYRSVTYSVIALLPFFVGVGGVVAHLAIVGEPFNFITMIALLMLCGQAVDYGIFAVDQWRRNVAMPERLESALLFCCLTTVMGVVPLVVASHPVLNSLGTPLLIGIVFGLLGGVVLVPEILKRMNRERRHV